MSNSMYKYKKFPDIFFRLNTMKMCDKLSMLGMPQRILAPYLGLDVILGFRNFSPSTRSKSAPISNMARIRGEEQDYFAFFYRYYHDMCFDEI